MTGTMLATSGSLAKAKQLQNRLFRVQQMVGDRWVDSGTLATFHNTAFLNFDKLYHVNFHQETASLSYSFGMAEAHRSARVFFTDDRLSFVGTLTSEAGGEVTGVRGSLAPIVFTTQRRQRPTGGSPDTPYADWETFSMGTHWDDQGHLVSDYKLGKTDVSDRTAVTHVVNWQTTIDMTAGNPVKGEGQDAFTITLTYDGTRFTGTYTDEDGTDWDWKGTATRQSVDAITANPLAFRAFDGPPVNRVLGSTGFGLTERETVDNAPDLSVQDLLNVSSITSTTIGGKTLVVDGAQTQTGLYFQNLLINAAPEPYLTNFFGTAKPVPVNVGNIGKQYKSFFEAKAVMNLGQLVHDNFATSKPDAVKRIAIDKINQAWKDLGKDEGYGAVSQALYIEGYRDGVPGIQPYLAEPDKWGLALYNLLLSESFLNTWAVQVASAQFSNIKQQMYEWWTQLNILLPNTTIPPRAGDAPGSKPPTYADDMLNQMFAVVLNSQIKRARWTEEMKPYLAQVIENMLNGDVSALRDEMLKNNAEAVRKVIQQMVSSFDTMEQLAGKISDFMTVIALRQRPAAAAGEEVYDAFRAFWQQVDPPQMTRWETFKDMAPKVFGAVLYAAGAAFIIYQLVNGQGINPIEGVSLGLLSTALIIKSIEKLMALGLGSWLQRVLATGQGELRTFASKLASWFTEGGIQAESWAVKVFGKSSAEFFAKRLGPALALLGLALSAWMLANAIKTGDVPNIVFESLNAFFALGTVVLIGLELFSVAWAGPVGLAIAVVGAIVALVQVIYNLIHPPAPPPDPVEQFIDGPLKQAGFVLS